MSRGIRVSEKHGVNPALGACEICGEATGDVLLLGRLPGDAEAPRKVRAGHCARCQEALKVGCALWESTGPSMEERTGRVLVMRDEAIRRIFNPPALVEDILRRRMALVDREGFQRIQQMAQQAKEESKP